MQLASTGGEQWAAHLGGDEEPYLQRRSPSPTSQRPTTANSTVGTESAVSPTPRSPSPPKELRPPTESSFVKFVSKVQIAAPPLDPTPTSGSMRPGSAGLPPTLGRLGEVCDTDDRPADEAGAGAGGD